MTRFRQRERQKLLERTIETMTVNSTATRTKFEAESRSRFVIVFEDGQDYMGMVVGFHPAEMLSVADGDGYIHSVPLTKVKADVGRRRPGELETILDRR